VLGRALDEDVLAVAHRAASMREIASATSRIAQAPCLGA